MTTTASWKNYQSVILCCCTAHILLIFYLDLWTYSRSIQMVLPSVLHIAPNVTCGWLWTTFHHERCPCNSLPMHTTIMASKWDCWSDGANLNFLGEIEEEAHWSVPCTKRMQEQAQSTGSERFSLTPNEEGKPPPCMVSKCLAVMLMCPPWKWMILMIEVATFLFITCLNIWNVYQIGDS